MKTTRFGPGNEHENSSLDTAYYFTEALLALGGILLVSAAVAAGVIIAVFVPSVGYFLGPNIITVAVLLLAGCVIPFALGYTTGRYGFLTGTCFGCAYVFIAMPWVWYGEHLGNYSAVIPGTPDNFQYVVLVFATLAGLAGGHLLTWRRGVRGKAQLPYMRHPLITIVPLTLITIAASLLAPHAITRVKEPPEEVLEFPEYGFRVTKPFSWHDMGCSNEFHEDDLIREGAIWRAWLHGPGEVRIYVYDSVPLTGEPLSGFEDADAVYDYIRRTLDVLRKNEPSTIAPTWIDYWWEGDVTVGGRRGIKIGYMQTYQDKDDFMNRHPGYRGDQNIFVYRKPYIYCLESSPYVITESLDFIPFENEPPVAKTTEPAPSRRFADVQLAEYRWAEPASEEFWPDQVLAVDPSHVWATAGSGLFYYDGSGWSRQFQARCEQTTVDGSLTVLGEDITDLCGLDERHVWAMGERGGFYFYDGSGWSKLEDLDGVPELVSAFDPEHIWGVDSTRRRDDTTRAYFYDGSDWSELGLLEADTCNGILAVDPGHVWVVGDRLGRDRLSPDKGCIYFYDGTSWSLQQVTEPYLEGLFALDEDNVWAYTRQGRVYFYDGYQWTEQFDAGSNPLIADTICGGFAFSRWDAWLVGSKGGLFHFDGHAWQKTHYGGLPRGTEIYEVSASDPAHVWGTSGRSVLRGNPLR